MLDAPAGDPGPFAELLARTNGSFLEGASHPDEMIARAKELGLAAIGVCDADGVYGMVKAHQAALEAGVKLLAGTRLTVRGAPVDERLEWDRDGQYFHYLTKWMHTRQSVVVEVRSGGASEHDDERKLERRRASVVGLTASGYLDAVDSDDPAIHYELMPSEFSFDLSKALIARKTQKPTSTASAMAHAM